MAEELTSYDRIPYRSHPFCQTHPNRLGTIARLFGLATAPPEECRVLELGCAGGGNLIPMAEQYHGSSFLGIDASVIQIDSGCKIIEVLGLPNVKLQTADILKFEVEPESFDYIVCHGVFSWVPNSVQDRILEICGTALRPSGVAYVSYNTYPGWRMRGMIRDIMRYRARSFDSPQVQLSQARNLLEFLYASVKGDDTAYSMLLKTELSAMSKCEDYYLIHEQLEEINEPLYFHQFMDRAAKGGLQYLGEADFGTMSLGNFPENVQNMLHSVSMDIIETEQYMDFLRNRAFRQTLLCRNNAVLERKPNFVHMQHLRVASSSRPETDVDLKQDAKITFHRGGSVLTTNNAYIKAAMLHLRSVWPHSVPFADLVSIARSMVEGRPGAVGVGAMNPGTQNLAETFLRCFETGQVDLHFSEPLLTTSVTVKPAVSGLTRLQARELTYVTNRWHETVHLDDLQRFVLSSLDGTRDAQGIADFLVECVAKGDLILHHEGRRIVEADQIRRFVEQTLPELLQGFAKSGLLIG